MAESRQAGSQGTKRAERAIEDNRRDSTDDRNRGAGSQAAQPQTAQRQAERLAEFGGKQPTLRQPPRAPLSGRARHLPSARKRSRRHGRATPRR